MIANPANIVKLTLQDYLDLYEFKKKMEDNNVAIVQYSSYPNQQLQYRYINVDKALEEITGINKKMAEMHERLSKDNQKLSYELAEASKKIPVEPVKKQDMSLKDFKTMSIWQFIKWRRKPLN